MSSIPLISHHLFVSAAGSATRRRHFERTANAASASNAPAHPDNPEVRQLEMELCPREQISLSGLRTVTLKKA